jgi:hypothetical protein
MRNLNCGKEWPHLRNFQETVQRKQSPNGRKFARSGHTANRAWTYIQWHTWASCLFTVSAPPTEMPPGGDGKTKIWRNYVNNNPTIQRSLGLILQTFFNGKSVSTVLNTKFF